MDQASSRTATGTLTVMLTLIGWSSIPLFLRFFADHIDPWTSNGWRYGFSALLWAPLLVFLAMRRRTPVGIWRQAIVPSIVNAAGQVTFCYAHYRIDPGLVTFGLRSHMFFAAIGAYILFAGERPVIRSPMYLIGVALVLVGTAGAMALGDGSTTLPGSMADVTVGVLLSVASGALFAAYALAVRKCMSAYRSVVSFAVISQYTAGAMVVLMLLLGERSGLKALDLSAGNFALLLLSAVIGIALGHVFYYMSMARLGVAVTTGVLQVHPFAVAVASYFVFGEVLSAPQWVSGSLAVVGALMMLQVQARLSRRPAPEPTPVLAGAAATRRR